MLKYSESASASKTLHMYAWFLVLVRSLGKYLYKKVISLLAIRQTSNLKISGYAVFLSV
jgi:hypothetical protein